MKNYIVNIVLIGLFVGGVFLIVKKKTSISFSEPITKPSVKKGLQPAQRYALDNQADQLRRKIDSLELETSNLKKALAKSDASLTTEDQGLIRLTNSFEKMNEKCDDFLNQRKQWDKERTAMQSNYAKLDAENRNLTDRVLALSQTNQQLSAQLSLAKLFEKDNICIARLDKNDQPNAKASKIKKIKVSMSLPTEMKSPVFKIFDSSGKMLPDQSGSFTSNFSNEVNLFGDKATRLELTYLVSKKVDPGSYRLDIDDEGKHVGNLLMNFR
jgi:septal ring factor EnvC (AmiA/AmiB activator)